VLNRLLTAIFGTIDVEKVVGEKAARLPEKLDWQHSIVDLLKVLDMESDKAALARLAKDLHYDGGAAPGSAELNTWLHAVVMKELEQRRISV